MNASIAVVQASIMRGLGRMLAALSLLAGMGAAPALAASCQNVQSPGIQLAGSFSVPRDLQPYQAVDTAATVTYVFRCKNVSRNDGAATIRMVLGNPVGAIPIAGGVIVPTSLQGVGVAITGPPGTVYDSSFGGFVVGAVAYSGSPTKGSVYASLTYQLVATGPISSGTVTIPGELLHFDYVTQQKTPHTLNTVYVPGSEHITALACTVDVGSRNMVVTLPDTPSSSFTGVGSTAGDTAFQLSLTCQAGTTVKISMSSSRADPSHTGVVLPATGAGYAAGVGVQVLDQNGTPVPINSATGTGTPAELTVGASPSGPLTIPFSARYFQTAAPVTGGKVSATVTFTMTYQ